MEDQNLDTYLRLLKRNCPAAIRIFFARTESEFMEAVELALQNAIQHMEAGAIYNCKRDECSLTHELVGCLGGGGVHVHNEAHSNGHVDVTVIHPQRTVWRVLGECKIYRGPVHHVEGCHQLLGRYLTGRMPHAFCLDFVQVPAIRDKMQAIRDHMDENRPLRQSGPSRDHMIHWAFTTYHVHSSGEHVCIVHLGCNVYYAKVK
jgi:hypothetical protein